MDYSIENGPVFTTLTVKLTTGETLRAEAGAMVSRDPSVELKSKTSGKGLGGMLKAAVGGEGLFISEFSGPGEVILAPAAPGDVLAFDMKGNTLLAASGAYIAGTSDLELSTQGSFKGMISGQGLFLQKISGNGTVFLNTFGSVIVKELKEGEEYIVDNGHLVAYESSMSYTIKKASKGLLSTFTSGEGLVCYFKGPGKLWLQSRNMKGFAAALSKVTGKP